MRVLPRVIGGLNPVGRVPHRIVYKLMALFDTMQAIYAKVDIKNSVSSRY